MSAATIRIIHLAHSHMQQVCEAQDTKRSEVVKTEIQTSVRVRSLPGSLKEEGTKIHSPSSSTRNAHAHVCNFSVRQV
jgi:hypothetical protein